MPLAKNVKFKFLLYFLPVWYMLLAYLGKFSIDDIILFLYIVSVFSLWSCDILQSAHALIL